MQDRARNNDRNQPQEPKEFEEKVIQISRVSKKTKGGNKMGFSILMVVGDRKGRVGVGLGKSKDVMSAIKKGVKRAKKKMITVPMNGTTIPFALTVKLGSGHIMLKPAPKGSGVIAGGPVRAVVEAVLRVADVLQRVPLRAALQIQTVDVVVAAADGAFAATEIHVTDRVDG